MKTQVLTLALALALVLCTGACGGGGGGGSSAADDGGSKAAPSTSGGSSQSSGGSSEGAADQEGQDGAQAEEPSAPQSGSGAPPPLTQGTEHSYLVPALMSGGGDAQARVQLAQQRSALLQTALAAAGILNDPAIQDGLQALDRFMNETLAGVRSDVPPVSMAPETVAGMALLDQLVITPQLLGPAQNGDPLAANLVRALYRVYAAMLSSGQQVGANWAATLAAVQQALNLLTTDPMPPSQTESENGGSGPLQIVEVERGQDLEGKAYVLLGLADQDDPQRATWVPDGPGVAAELTPDGLFLRMVGDGEGSLVRVTADIGTRHAEAYIWVGKQELPAPTPGSDSDTAVVQGMVMDENENTVADAMVSIHEESPAGASIGSALLTGANGTFAMEIPLEHGPLVVVISANGFQPEAIELAPQAHGGEEPEKLTDLGMIKLKSEK